MPNGVLSAINAESIGRYGFGVFVVRKACMAGFEKPTAVFQ
jgi:hypothetical protein